MTPQESKKFIKSTKTKSLDQETKGKAKLTKTKLSDPVIKEVTKTCGSLLIILSGVILITDKIYPNLQLSNNYGYQDTQTFIWVLSQTLSPFLILIAVFLKPYRISYMVPVYLYFIQMYWVFDPSLKWDDKLLHLYASGVVISFIVLAIGGSYIIQRAHNRKAQKIQLLNSMLDLYFKADGRG